MKYRTGLVDSYTPRGCTEPIVVEGLNGYMCDECGDGFWDHDSEERISAASQAAKSAQNLYADVGLPDAEAMQARCDLAMEIIEAINARGWSQKEAAEFLGVETEVVSQIYRGQFRQMPVESLAAYLERIQ